MTGNYLLRLTKQTFLLLLKVTAILGAGLIDLVYRLFLGQDSAVHDDELEENHPAMYSMDPARGLDPLNYFGVLHEDD